MKVYSNINSVQNEFQRINRISKSIAKRELDKLPENFVNLNISQRDIEANLKVIKTYDELIGSIIDIFA